MMWYHYPMFGNFGFGGWIFSLAFWILVVVLIVSLFHGWSNKGSRHDSKADDNQAMNILKQRYAKGEIDKKQFDAMKKDLS